MGKKQNKHFNVGTIDIPEHYSKLSREEKNEVCDLIIDNMLKQIDKYLLPEYNRITFLNGVFQSSLESNEQEEEFEVCQVILDCKNRLNED